MKSKDIIGGIQSDYNSYSKKKNNNIAFYNDFKKQASINADMDADDVHRLAMEHEVLGTNVEKAAVNFVQYKGSMEQVSNAAKKTKMELKSFDNSIASFGKKIATTFADIGLNMLISAAIAEVIKITNDLINYSKQLDQASEATSKEFDSEKKSLNGLKDEAQKYIEIMNDSNSSVEEVTQAREGLLGIQQQVADKFSVESDAAKTLTNALVDQKYAMDDLNGAFEKLKKKLF